MYEYQVTLICTTGQYKPVSCIIKSNKVIDLKNKQEKINIINKGILKICAKKYWTKRDLDRYSYKRIKIRQYNKEAIQLESIDRYRKIKRQRYNAENG